MGGWEGGMCGTCLLLHQQLLLFLAAVCQLFNLGSVAIGQSLTQ